MRALGERKATLFRKKLKERIDPAPGAETLLKKLRDARIKTAVASSSKNCAIILASAGLSPFIDASADGLGVLAGVEAGRRGGFRCAVGVD